MVAKHLFLAVLISILMFCVLVGLALAAGPTVRETALNAQGSPYEITADASGNLWIGDYTAREIWQVNATTGDAEVYEGLESPFDPHRSATGEVWWADGEHCALGELFPGSSSFVTWTLGTECVPLGVALDDGGRIWVSQVVGSDVFSFQPADREVCSYTLPDNGVASYLTDGKGRVWLGDRVNARLVAISPESEQLTTWQLPLGNSPYDLALNASGQVWWSAYDLPNLNRLDPANNRLTTYALPSGQIAYKIALSGNDVWYTTDRSGSFGQLDPLLAANSVVTLTPVTVAITPTCETLPPAVEHTVTVRSETANWLVGMYTPTVTTGWADYQLPSGAAPFGIANTGRYTWVVDFGRHMLEKVGAAFETFLPNVHK